MLSVGRLEKYARQFKALVRFPKRSGKNKENKKPLLNWFTGTGNMFLALGEIELSSGSNN